MDLKEMFGYEPASLGEKIHLYRELRGLTQKEVGKRVGYSENTAETRMGRYENDKNRPKEETIDSLARALEINRDSLYKTSFKSFNAMCHALFDIGVMHGLIPVLAKDGNFYLKFAKTSQESVCYATFLEQWHDAMKMYEVFEGDSEEERRRKQKEFALWRAKYPDNEEFTEVSYADWILKLKKRVLTLIEKTETKMEHKYFL